jgi:hypothetical protein
VERAAELAARREVARGGSDQAVQRAAVVAAEDEMVKEKGLEQVIP